MSETIYDRPVPQPIDQAIASSRERMSDPMKVELLRRELLDAPCRSDARYRVSECYAAKTCGCTIGLTLTATDDKGEI